MRRNSKIARQRGISLVEIMVSLVAGLILTGGVIHIYSSNKQVYRLDDAAARLQENARFAMELLARDLRLAGYQGCSGAARIFVNTLNDTTSFLYDFNTAVQGLEATSTSAWHVTPPSSLTSPSPLGGSDIIAVRGIFDKGVTITGQPNNSADCTTAANTTADLKVASTTWPNGQPLTAGDIVIAGNCLRVSVFQITSVNTSTQNVVHNTGGTSPGNATKDLQACYAGNGELSLIKTRTFYIGNNGAGRPALYRKDGASAAEELVEGVENLQILYGLDSDGDGAANQFLRANDVADWSQVASIRVSLLLQSSEDNVTTSPQSYQFNGAAVTPTDRRLRRVLTTTIGIRNRLP